MDLDVILEEAEVWMVYGLVAARADAHEQAELKAMTNLGGEPWRRLRDKLQDALRTAVTT